MNRGILILTARFAERRHAAAGALTTAGDRLHGPGALWIRRWRLEPRRLFESLEQRYNASSEDVDELLASFLKRSTSLTEAKR